MDLTAPGCQFRHTRDLLSLLFIVAPEVVKDPNLLNRSVLLTGVTPHTTAEDLLELFPLKAEASAVVRDYETGERAGLVVLANDGDCDKAIDNDQKPAPRLRGRVIFYRACIKARAWQEPYVLLDAANDHARRRATTDLLRSLLPPVYIQGDASIHMRCIFLRGAYDVGSLDETLPAIGGVCAIVACKSQSIAVLVYDDADSAEEVARSLVGSRRVRMYDSPMFPFDRAATVMDTPEAAAGDQLRGMIPSFYCHPEYLGRIVLFRGLDTEHCDARHVACCINNGLEALIVHRSQRLVVALFSNKEDARLQLHETEETWKSIFGLPLTCELLDGAQKEPFVALDEEELEVFAEDEEELEVFAEDEEELEVFAEDEEELVAPGGRPYPDVHSEAIQQIHYLIDNEMKACAPDDAAGIAEVLIKLVVFSRPDALRHKDFPNRAVLLLGIHPARDWDHLWAALSTYGALDDLCVCSPTSAALAVFKKWNAAFKLLQEPLQSCWRIGFCSCQQVPGAERAAEIADEVCAKLFKMDADLNMSQL